MQAEWFDSPPEATRVLGIGLVALDVVERGGEISGVHAGGTCGNVLAILSYLGWQSFPVARLNGDDAAVHIRKDLRHCAVRLDYASTGRSSATPIVRHILPRDPGLEHRFSLRCPLCHSWLPTHQPVVRSALPAMITDMPAMDVIFIDRASPAALRLAEQMRRRGSLIVFEPSARARRGMVAEMLSLADVLKYSSTQADALALPRRGMALEIETRGAAGLRYRCSAGSWRDVKARDIPAVRDPAGAGDWCTAGFLHALLGHRSAATRPAETLVSETAVRYALGFGQALAAWNCLHEGARGAMYAVPRRSLRRGVQRHVLMRQERRIHSDRDGGVDRPARRAATFFANLCSHCAEAT
jgi:fructokinase